MSWIRIRVQLIFTTKYREIYFADKEIKDKVIAHIKANAKEKDIWLEEIGGDKNHLHFLISIGIEQTISKICQLIKGESSKWINENKLTAAKFEWQDDYRAVSVSEAHVKNVKKYIQNQEEHHRVKNLSNEIDELIKKAD